MQRMPRRFCYALEYWGHLEDHGQIAWANIEALNTSLIISWIRFHLSWAMGWQIVKHHSIQAWMFKLLLNRDFFAGSLLMLLLLEKCLVFWCAIKSPVCYQKSKKVQLVSGLGIRGLCWIWVANFQEFKTHDTNLIYAITHVLGPCLN